MTSNDTVIFIDQCLIQPSFERLSPAPDGNKYRTHRQTLHNEESLEHMALNGRFPSNPTPQSARNPLEEGVERV